MRHLWLIALSLLMTACETIRPPIDFTFEEFELVTADVTYPEELPKMAKLECYPGEGDECLVSAYSRIEDVDTFELYLIRADSNTTIAEQNAVALDATLEKANQIVLAGRSQENITKIIQEQLANSESQRKRDKWYYRGMLILMGGAVIVVAE